MSTTAGGTTSEDDNAPPSWFRRVLEGGVRDGMTPEKTRAIRVTNFSLLALAFISTPYVVIFSRAGLDLLALLVPLLSVVYISLLLVVRAGHHNAGAFGFIVVGTLASCVFVVSLGVEARLDFCFLIGIVMTFLVFTDENKGARAFGVLFSMSAFVACHFIAANVAPVIPVEQQRLIAVFSVPGIMLFVASCVGFQVRVSERQRERLTELHARALEANQTKSRFLANMSHELRTPLNSVIGFSRILSKNKKGNLSEKQLDKISRIHKNGVHLLQLVNDVLDHSRIEAGMLDVVIEPTAVADVVRTAIEQLQPAAAANGVSLLPFVPSKLAAIEADPHRLLQIVLNMLSNAVKFTPPGGRVQIRLVGDRTPQRIEVSDTGPGIAPAKQALVFEEFRQADETTAREHGGTGLGLPISRKLAELMGFRLELRSEVGAGSTFTLLLHRDQVAPSHQVPDPYTPPQPARLERSIPRVLDAPEGALEAIVIDDDADARELLQRQLEELGMHVTAVGNGPDGLAEIRRRRPALVTVDVMMPGTTGWEVLQEIRKDAKISDTPVLVVSQADGRSIAKRLGADDFFKKPLDPRFAERVTGIVAEAPTSRSTQ